MLSLRSVHDADAFYQRKRRGYRNAVESGMPLAPFEEWLTSGMLSGFEFRYNDMTSNLLLDHDGVVMEARGGGPSNVAAVLRRAVDDLSHADGQFAAHVDDASYGLHLRFTRNGERLLLERVREDDNRPGGVVPEADAPPGRLDLGLEGPSSLDVDWEEFVEAVEVYKRWHVTEHVAEAPWLLRVPLVQEWRIEAGLSPDTP